MVRLEIFTDKVYSELDSLIEEYAIDIFYKDENFEKFEENNIEVFPTLIYYWEDKVFWRFENSTGEIYSSQIPKFFEEIKNYNNKEVNEVN